MNQNVRRTRNSNTVNRQNKRNLKKANPKNITPRNKLNRDGKESLDAQRIYGFDYTLFITLLFLLAFGLVMLYSVSFNTAYNKFEDGLHFVSGQLKFIILGFVAMLIIVHFKSSFYGGWRAWLLYIASMVLMLMVRFGPFGVELNGAKRWLNLPWIGLFQPSEFMKVAIIALVPTIIYKMKVVELNLYSASIASIPILAAFFVTWFGTNNLSTAIIILGIGIGMLSLLAPNFEKLVILGGQLLLGSVIMIALFGEFLFKIFGGFRLSRLFVWTNIEEYSTSGGYQVLQGLYAIGSGGLFGKGLGNGTQKLSSIPEVQNDMIFSAISEELGIVGLLILLFLYGVLLYRLFIIASNAPTLHSSLIISGIFLHIALQVVVNLCVVTNLLPNTGVTLPFISYGGTALLVLICEISIALGISRE